MKANAFPQAGPLSGQGSATPLATRTGTSPSEGFDGWRRVDGAGLAALGGLTVLALVGFVTFALNPESLARFPQAAEIYPKTFPFFAQAHITLAFVALSLSLAVRVGARWVPAFVAVFVLALSAELSGTALGWLFSPYEYTAFLGPKIWGLVPWLIPVSWFFMAVPSYALASGLNLPIPAKVVVGAILLTTWDLTLDPAMSELAPYWIWSTPGPFYGMPLQNIVGWLVTSAVLMVALELLKTETWTSLVPRSYWWAYYLSVLALSVGMTLAAGFWWALVATGLCIGAVVSALQLSSGGSSTSHLGSEV